MFEVTASCNCAKIQIKLSLPKPLQDYAPRLCDCDFCTERNAAYLSDPDGVLDVSGAQDLEFFKQGSEQALFWQCKSCHSLILVSNEFAGDVKGAVNIALFTTEHPLADGIKTSPKMLAPEVKRQRWQKLWLKVNFSE